MVGTIRGGASANRPLVWIALVIALALGLGGYVFGLWSAIGWYDEVTHFVASFAVTLWIGLWMYGAVLGGADDHPVVLVLTVTIVGLGVGAAWELFEFARDHLTGPQNVIRGKFDTMMDLIIDTAGAFVASLVVVSAARD